VSGRTPPASDEQLLHALDRLDDSVPMEDVEVGKVLSDVGVDPRAELTRAMVLVENALARERSERYARAANERGGALRRLSAGVAPRPRAQNLARLRQLQATAPTGSELHANFKNFETASDEDLDRIVAEFEHLLGENDDE
jgi:hypothetical protein